eukprot:TRINITY_DN5099_c3_g1_i2.p1 TRINITY_DN5099_c3_g1~~TRINITY_DN5099_c3_g1_i2.p1  ORF type:complete len:206 (+),score=74.05 TRINITY_DN5099_c3_g1_i2:167-784(+)
MGSMASQLPKEVREGFKELDANQDGVVSIKELQDMMLQVYPKYGVEPYEIADLSSLILRAADDDESGVISVEEFAQNRQLQELVSEKLAHDKQMRNELQMLKRKGTRVSTEECGRIRAMFDKYDTDKSGSLDTKELHEVLRGLCKQPISTQEARLILEEIDVDKSGKIEPGEMIDWWPTVETFIKNHQERIKQAAKQPASKKGRA